MNIVERKGYRVGEAFIRSTCTCTILLQVHVPAGTVNLLLDVVHKRLEFFGRHLLVKRSAGKIAFFKFSELCDQVGVVITRPHPLLIATVSFSH